MQLPVIEFAEALSGKNNIIQPLQAVLALAECFAYHPFHAVT